jgi:outer membrane receptor protein involved in Fe transport
MFRPSLLILLFSGYALCARAESAAPGALVKGAIVDQASGHPIEYVTVALTPTAPSGARQRTATDAKGEFAFESVPAGEYALRFALVGSHDEQTARVTVDPDRRTVDLGLLRLQAPAAVQMEKVEVSARREAFYNSIDRKVYNVGKDIRSATGSASDLLQNVPSVQVDIDGNISLRGNDNVLVLINGKPSTLMSTTNRGDVLAQMPADSIDRVEVITNPSAKYKPDGTAGIINLVQKRKRDAGFSGVLRTSVGNQRRANASLSANYNPGRYNVYGTVSVRQDDRPRFSTEERRHLDVPSNTWISTEQHTEEYMRPRSWLAQLGGDYNPTEATKLGLSASYNDRRFFRTGVNRNLSRTDDGTVTGDYDRSRGDNEWQNTTEVDARVEHSFADEGHDFTTELKHDRHQEQEDNRYTNRFRIPTQPTTFDSELIKPTETGTELTTDYTRPLADDAKLEAGYSGEFDRNDMDFRGASFDPVSQTWTSDVGRTNRFIYKDRIQAIYATYGRPIGRFGFLAGLRVEQTDVHTNQVTAGLTDHIQYYRLHPTLHLSYNLTDTGQLQLNYSHRVHRPESDDLNPFPEYQDPYNLRAGNPKLRPEETHSLEAGYQYRKDETTILGTVYYRDTYHAFSTVTRYIDPVTSLTTHENLASNRSGGLELALTGNVGSRLSLNLSANAFYSEIDATNLGFSGNRSATAWSMKLNADWHATPSDLLQLNTNYNAKRLTAQGYRDPNFIANLGYRHELKAHNLAFILTVSDVFNSLRERSVIDTPLLHDVTTRRRSTRIIYAGLIYTFGKPAKKKDNGIHFDEQI